jgi:N-acetylmuramoyl-L-alanine amidase
MSNFFSKLRNFFAPQPTQTKPMDKPSQKYSETVKLTPQTNGPRALKIKPRAIVMHDTGGSYLGSIDWTGRVINPDTGLRLYASYHCIIARDGRRTIINLDDNRAYHAGASSFKGENSLNNWSIGVAFERDSYKEPLQQAAIESAIEYIVPRMKKWGIPLDMVTDHRTVSPNRKVDLNPKEFAKFYEALKKSFK